MYYVLGLDNKGNIINSKWGNEAMAYQIYYEHNNFGGVVVICDSNHPSAYKEYTRVAKGKLVEKYRGAVNSGNLDKACELFNIMKGVRDRQLKTLEGEIRRVLGVAIKTKQRLVIASMSITNTASMNIYEVVDGIEPYVVAGMSGDKEKRYKLYDTESKGSYFNYKGRRYYLNEFMRVAI